jgi:hypothetical protein
MDIVALTLGHFAGRRLPGHTCVFMYHFGKPSLRVRPPAVRDNDPNSGKAFDPMSTCGERWQYIGNLFDMLPYAALTATREHA